MQKISMARF